MIGLYIYNPKLIIRSLGSISGIQTIFQNQVFDFEVISESQDELFIQVDYFYNGKCGKSPFLGVITLKNGKSTGYWVYTSAKIHKGAGSTRVKVGMNDNAPKAYQSDELKFKLSSKECGVFFETSSKYEKKWIKTK